MSTYDHTLQSRRSKTNVNSKKSNGLCLTPSCCRKRTARVTPKPTQSLLPEAFFEIPLAGGHGEMPDMLNIESSLSDSTIPVSSQRSDTFSSPTATYSFFNFVFDRIRRRRYTRNKTSPLDTHEDEFNEAVPYLTINLAHTNGEILSISCRFRGSYYTY